MATTVFPIPVANGRVHTTNQPTVVQDADTNLGKWVAQFDPSSEQRLHFAWFVPGNWSSGNLTVRLRWRANATTGDCVWKAYYLFNAANGYVAGASAASTATVTTTTAGTANLVNESVLTLTLSAGSTGFYLTIARDAAAGGDTLAVVSELLEMVLEYTSDATIAKQYLWVPAQCLAIPAGSSAVHINNGPDSGSIIQTDAIKYNDAASNYADFRFSLPGNYSGGLTISFIVYGGAAGHGAMKFTYGAASSAVGAASDPALTTGSAFTVPDSGASNGYALITATTLPITPAAGDEVLIRMTRDSTDASTAAIFLIGLLVQYSINARDPQVIRMDPGSGVSSGTPFQQVDDTNSSKFIARFAQSVDTRADYVAMMPSTYVRGGTLRVRWRSSGSSGNAVFRIDWGSPANASASDPSLASSSNVTSACAGANLVNEFTVDVSSGIAASDLLLVRVNRLGTNGSDTLAAAADLLEVVLESNTV